MLASPWSAGLIAALTVACAPPAPEPPDGAAVIARFACDRCHDGGQVFPAAEQERSCVGCHQAILAGGYDDQVLPEDAARWKAHLHRLNASPSLASLDRRVTRRWLVAWLQAPTDLRRGLEAEMPRLPLSAADAEAVADAFGVVDPPAWSVPPGDGDRGRALIEARCAGCHDGADPLAPELAQVRGRSAPALVAAWLADPRAVKPDATMPAPDLAPDDVRDVLAALFDGGLAPAPRPEVPPAAPPPAGPVRWPEVDARVFHEVCRHCHADPVPMDGDGGPGNTGGFGFAPVGLDLSSFDAVRRADPRVLDPDAPTGLVGRLWARHAEVAGRPVPGVVGMPLGLPPLPPDAIALVDAWLRQGAPP